MDKTNWLVHETAFDPTHLHHKETVFTLGNGYLGARGAFEEGLPGAWPATLIHGIFDDAPIVYTELANCPDWLPLYIFVQGERFRLDRGEILGYCRQLDLYRAVLSREVRWRSPAGHVVDLRFERFASLADEHALAIRCQVTAVDAPCQIEVQAGINGYPDNMGLLHWEWLDQGAADGTAWLHTRTRQSGSELGLAVRLTVNGHNDVPARTMNSHNCPALVATFQAAPGQTITLEKTVAVFSSRDTAAPAQAARDRLAALPNYAALLAAHEAEWARMWQDCDVVIEGDSGCYSNTAQLAIRYNLYQVLIAAPRHDERVSVSAKTLSGFGYRGHAFWDTEIFLLPFLSFTRPALARNLLTYRYHTLPGARRKARDNGYAGAMFAWESAATGDEVTPRWVPGPQGEELVRIWCGDIELHITTDIAYAIWNYWRVTGDDEWMRRCGAEIVLDTAVFWGERAAWNDGKQCYEINDVIGPDENHEHVNNSVFTNRMVQWHLETAIKVLEWLRAVQPTAWADPGRATELTGQLALTPERLAHWADICRRILILHDPETGMFEEFEGFFKLKDVNWQDLAPRTRSMQAILGIQGANEAQVLKQADVVMLLYLLRDHYDRRTMEVNWDYYVPRTDHTYGSSLGPATHAAMAAILDKPVEALEHWMRAALVDLEDVRGNAADGVHAASAGGLWQATVFGFGGIHLTENGPVAAPRLPPGWTRLKFRLCWRGQWFDFDLQ